MPRHAHSFHSDDRCMKSKVLNTHGDRANFSGVCLSDTTQHAIEQLLNFYCAFCDLAGIFITNIVTVFSI